MRYIGLYVFAALLTAAGCSAAGLYAGRIDAVVGSSSKEYAEALRKSFELAGDNFPELDKFVSAVSRERRRAAEFLVANMSPALLASANASDLLSEFRLAFRARETFPWGKKVTGDMFLHTILPNCIAQEPFEKYREYLLPQLRVALENCTTMTAAALEINRFCGARYGYKHTQRRDQGVFESLRRGHGRCEEMMILYMACARTACLPSRQVSTPRWALGDSNHAWVEVWCDGRWHYLGACEPADELDTAWFTNSAKHAPLVLAIVHGGGAKPGEGETVYRNGERETMLNVTSNYAPTSRIAISVTSGGGPVKGGDVYLHVFNNGGLSPFARVILDDRGRGSITTGVGDYFATISREGEFASKKISASGGGDVKAAIELGKDELNDGFSWLKYPEAGK